VANNQTAPDMDQDDANLTTDQKVARIENQLQYMMNQNNQAKSLGGYITEQQGQIEQLNYQVSQMQKQLAFVEQRVVQLEATIKIDEMKSKPATATMSAIPANKQESALFQSAYNALMQKQYSQAINGFNNFLKNYPNSTLVPDAHYWLGELYLVQGQPDKASQQFRFVVKNPKSDKAPDAMLKLGMIFLAYGDSAHAKETFQKVMSLYPNSNAAQLAKTQLSSM
jgi:tol-pal system protein YbgF